VLILLDIDGVLIHANSWRQPEFHSDGFPLFNATSAKALQLILSETGAAILLTTSHKTKYTVSQWLDILKSRGIEPKELKRLTINSLLITRKEEILEWYEQHHVSTETFVIIDDDKMLNGLPENIKSSLILTSPSVGLTDDLAKKAISILLKPIDL